MKHLKKRIFSLAATLAMIISLIPLAYAATYDYPVEGGNLKFDPSTGTITDCDTSVYSADIPSEIYGVPVVAIKDRAFYNCKKLTNVVIPSSVTRIENGAFCGCSQLRTIKIPDSVTEFYDTKNGWGLFRGCSSLETIEIPGSVKKIPYNSFSGCTNLKTIILGEGIEEIADRVFVNCDSLEEITIPDSVKSISYDVFSNCKTLSTVTMGSGLKSMGNLSGNFVFNNCRKLEAIYFRGNAPAANKIITSTRGTASFADGFKIYYPEGASGWTTPTWNGYITESYVLNNSNTPTTPGDTASIPSTQPQNLTISGQQVDTWALELVNEAIAANLVPNSLGNDLRTNITREQFAGVAVKLYEAMSGATIQTPPLADNKFTDTSNVDVRKAYTMGFVSGTSTTTFSPNSPLTREQSAVILSNVYKALGGVINARNPGTFADDVAISNWARNAVYFMSENGIVSGVGNNTFDPQGKTQSQAALIIALKMLQNLK